MAKLALKAHALGDLQWPVANGNPACESMMGVAPMETVLSILVSVLAFIVTPILAWLIGVIFFAIPLGVLAMYRSRIPNVGVGGPTIREC